MKNNSKGLVFVVILVIVGITVLGFLTVQKPDTTKPAVVGSNDVELQEVTREDVKTAKTVKKSPWSCEDSTFEYQAVANENGLIAIAGTDSWQFDNSETGKSKVETNPKIYLLKPSAKEAKELPIPRVSVFDKKAGKDRWTNQGFHQASTPMFLDGWLIATTTLREDEIALVGWDLTSKRDKVLYVWEECEEPNPSQETLAFRYLAKVEKAKFAKAEVGAHEIKVGNQVWTR